MLTEHGKVIHGWTHKWRAENRKLQKAAKRVNVFHNLDTSEYDGLILMAPTGSGKTTRYVIPNLLELEGSAVVTDPSGEIYQATSGQIARRGFGIQVLQPAAPGGSLRFNPLRYFRKADNDHRKFA